ncbi:ATP-binding protein [Agrobacterium sp. B1(2019)]|uniref:ATP-binding protein n=1 Tax=Agrobacterium sp. B1(2019) TaxID=2607032 RepID=UPI0011EBD181|nr:ATP-binding protein [Agrobacterium sp. B1(2019)]TZG36536.1 PAS domain-containing protein [Agrobacterium sp. B1(2019)]
MLSAIQQNDLFDSQIAEAVSECVVVYDQFGHIVYWNRAAGLLYGRSQPEVIGKSIRDVFMDTGANINWTELKRVGFWEGVVHRTDRDGMPVLVHISVRTGRDRNGNTDRYIECGSIADTNNVERQPVGLQKDWLAVWRIDASFAATALDQIARRVGPELTKLTDEDIALIAEHLHVIDLNATAAKLFAGDEMAKATVGGSAYASWPKKHQDRLLQMTIKMLSGQGADQMIIREAVDKDVLAVWRDGSRYANTILACIQGSLRDLEPYWDLAASEQRYRTLIDNVPLPVWQVDARVMTGVIERLKASGVTDISVHLRDHPNLVAFASEAVVVTDVNESAIKLFKGSCREDFISDVRYLFAGTPEAGARVVMAHFEGGRNYSEEMKIRTFDGELRDVLFYVTFPQFPEKLDKTLIIMIDVTEQRRLERQFRKIEADLAHAARISVLGELVTSIAHEVRQPLSVVATDAETALQWLMRDDSNLPKLRAIIGRIQKNAHRANQVISRIKDMAVKTEPSRALVNVNDIIREAVLLVQPESMAHRISITMRLQGELPQIVGDRVQLQQVIINLLINSIQAIATNGNSLQDIVVETTGDRDEGVQISVQDTGGGIAPDDIDEIFDGFFSRKAEGMGMGLAICRSIIANHGGTITARNNGTGAQFTVALPLPAQVESEPG